MSRSARPPVLLVRTYRDGMMAAIRSLGRDRIPVAVGFRNLHEPGVYSRYARRRLRMRRGSVRGLSGLHRWLLEWGAANRGHVLMAADDSTAWLFSRFRDELSAHFHLFQPTADAMTCALDKFRLAQACMRSGLGAPKTWLLDASAEALVLPDADAFPGYVKRRSQVGAPGEWKGVRAPTAAALALALPGARARAGLDALPRKECPELAGLILQPDLGAGDRPVHTLSGFVDASGELRAARAQEKLLQRPVGGGVGVVFEDAPVRNDLVAALAALFRDVGYCGTFQAEFLRAGDRLALIDFNPRFQKAVAYDVARGMDLPLMVYAAAIGDQPWLARLYARARRPYDRSLVFCERADLRSLIRSGELPGPEAARWKRWLHDRRGHIVDPGSVPSDPLPGLVLRASRLVRSRRAVKSPE